MAPPAPDHGTVICVGDLHGNIHKLRSLWAALKEKLGDERLEAATIIFLGDYCDRGPDTRAVIDWLIDLEARRLPGSTLFIAGNHDLGFALYIGVRAFFAPPDFDLDGIIGAEKMCYAHPVDGGMHRLGRRWGQGHVETFESYGVRFAKTPEARAALQDAVPESHKRFLEGLHWVLEIEAPFGRVTCVHAGLNTEAAAEPQLEALRARDISAAVLQTKEYGRIDALSGRMGVICAHPDVGGVLISGHHRKRMGVDKGKGLSRRIIMDFSGGYPMPERKLEAVVLPDAMLVSSLDMPGALEEQQQWLDERKNE